MNVWRTGLCCKSLIDEGLAPILSRNSSYRKVVKSCILFCSWASEECHEFFNSNPLTIRLNASLHSGECWCLSCGRGLKFTEVAVFSHASAWTLNVKTMGNKQTSQLEPIKLSPHNESLSKLFKVSRAFPSGDCRNYYTLWILIFLQHLSARASHLLYSLYAVFMSVCF